MFTEETFPSTRNPSGSESNVVDATTPFSSAVDARFRMGASRSPEGKEITVDSRSLLRDGERWLPVMGEFHYARYPRTEWRDELLKMKMGGIDIVATYVFWIHHEEIEGEFDWHDQRNLREFVALCGELGLYSVVRGGPWCHGEVRNGGLPDWLLASGCQPRSDDPAYLRPAHRLYEQIARQIEGLLWKDGGPVIGFQCENEYGGPAEHLLTLKNIAREAGIDVPLYTRTGWPELTTAPPPGELMPLFGGYPDGFWDRAVSEMPPGFAENFLFRTVRADVSVATDQLGVREIGEEPENRYYPYFACEIGGGMMPSYHRRIRIAPADITALALAKIGSGNNLQGYYMYHGGTNPEAKLTTLQESQATNYWNDLPVKTYDFQAPLGEFGQVRPHYHSLRCLHQFLRDFGPALSTMPTFLPEMLPKNTADDSTLRWAVRTDGRSGFLFVNNYQRLAEMPPKSNVRFDIRLGGGTLCVPSGPVTIPANSSFFWPLHLSFNGADLIYATAQPLCRLTAGQTTYVVFSTTGDVPAEFVFDATATVESTTGTVTATASEIRIARITPGTDAAIRLRTPANTRLVVILLDEKQAMTCWKAELRGQERLFLSAATLICGDDSVRLSATDPADFSVSILPAPALMDQSMTLEPTNDGLFQHFAIVRDAPAATLPVSVEQIRAAGTPRPVSMGSAGVAEAPTDDDFGNAAVWRIVLPQPEDLTRDLILRIRYYGDVARIYRNGVLLNDNFYNGDPFEIGLRRSAPGIYTDELLLKILPLSPDAPIYLPADAWSQTDNQAAPVIEIYETYTAELTVVDDNGSLPSTHPYEPSSFQKFRANTKT
ncbi:MAG: beta-galactosidase [Fibrella sp.]|nr:beta-galactosidase [Armatimonadota bacterium]